MISFFNPDIDFNLPRKRILSKWLKEILLERGFHVGQINYIFCSDDYLININRDFLGHDHYTDVITFDYSSDFEIQYGPNSISGDIYISIDTVRRNAELYDEGFHKELHRVMVHGILHLIGFDDTSVELKAEMTQQEDNALQLLSLNKR